MKGLDNKQIRSLASLQKQLKDRCATELKAKKRKLAVVPWGPRHPPDSRQTSPKSGPSEYHHTAIKTQTNEPKVLWGSSARTSLSCYRPPPLHPPGLGLYKLCVGVGCRVQGAGCGVQLTLFLAHPLAQHALRALSTFTFTPFSSVSEVCAFSLTPVHWLHVPTR